MNDMFIKKRNNTADFSFCNEKLEKFGERRLIGRGEYFARSGEVMEYAWWIVTGYISMAVKLQAIRMHAYILKMS